MRPLILCLMLTAAVMTRADDLTVGSTVYKKWSVLKVEPDGLKIEHADGITKIPMEQLPPELAAKYKFDPAAAKAHREKKSAGAKAVDDAAAAAAAKDAAAAKPAMPAEKPAAAAPANAKEPDPQGWEEVEPDPAMAVKGKTYGIADVQASMHQLNGKIIRVEVIVNSASQIESIDAGSCRMFAGTIFKDNSNYEFIGFPSAGEAKMRTMLRSAKGKMLFWVRVEAENRWPYPQLWVVGRTLSDPGLGAKAEFKW